MLKYFKSHRLMSIALAVLVVFAIGIGVYAASIISNLWQSPAITVTNPPPPSNEPLVISSIDFTASANITTGVAFPFSVNLRNPSLVGAPGYPDVIVNINIYGVFSNALKIINPNDLKLEYSDGSNWYVIPTTFVTDRLTTNFGPASGFPVPSGYNQTTQFRVTFNTPGVYNATAQAVTVP